MPTAKRVSGVEFAGGPLGGKRAGRQYSQVWLHRTGSATSVMADPLDRDTVALARRIGELGAGQEAHVYRMSWWSDRMLDWAMSHPSFKTQLFRFVDVFPAMHGDADVLRHVREYFEGDRTSPGCSISVSASPTPCRSARR